MTSVFRLGFRPELDGIRGISILLVLAHHLSPSHLWGGFLGVDIFFVLSGFLITTLLVQEWQASGTISLKRFYLRRILRLMPALLTMLALVCGYVWLFLDAEKAADAFRGAGVTLAYISNWVQAFKPNYPMGPFGITWSLSIEEQFYLIWPILLLTMLHLLKRKAWLIGGLIVAILLVTAHRYILWQNGGVESWRLYYGTDTRADALLCGCLAGLLLSWEIIHRHSSIKRYLKIFAILSVVSLAFLVLMVRNDSKMLSLGGFTLIELMISTIIIVVLLWPPAWVSAFLNIAPLIWFGRISYGLYLWHWPIFVLFNPKQGIGSAPYRLMAAALAIALSAASYYLIEKPSLNLKKRFEPSPVPVNEPAYGTVGLLVQNN